MDDEIWVQESEGRMAGLLWAKWWAEAIDDPKLWTMPLEQRFLWPWLIGLATKCGTGGWLEIAPGHPMTDEVIAASCHCPLELWAEARDYFLAVGMLDRDEDGKTLRLAKWDKRQAVDPTGAERSRRFRENQKKARDAEAAGEDQGAPAEGAPDLPPLEAALACLNTGKGSNGKATNPNAVLARLYSIRFSELTRAYPASYGRLGKMANELSGGAVALARLIWQAPAALEGDPHDYLGAMVHKSKASYRPANGNGANGNGRPVNGFRFDATDQALLAKMQAEADV